MTEDELTENLLLVPVINTTYNSFDNKVVRVKYWTPEVMQLSTLSSTAAFIKLRKHLQYTLAPDNNLASRGVNIRKSPGSTMETPQERRQHFNDHIVTTSYDDHYHLLSSLRLLSLSLPLPMLFSILFSLLLLLLSVWKSNHSLLRCVFFSSFQSWC